LEPSTTFTEDARGAKAAAEAGNSWGGILGDLWSENREQNLNEATGDRVDKEERCGGALGDEGAASRKTNSK
jgi:hypothetical protein